MSLLTHQIRLTANQAAPGECVRHYYLQSQLSA